MPENKIQIIFEAIDKNVKQVADEIKDKLGETAGWSGGFEEAGLAMDLFAGAAGLAAGAMAGIAKELGEIVKLSKEQPELFTAEQLETTQEYGAAIAELKTQFLETKVAVATEVMPAITELITKVNDAETAMYLAAAAGDTWALLSEQQADAYYEQAAALETAIEKTESFDMALQRLPSEKNININVTMSGAGFNVLDDVGLASVGGVKQAQGRRSGPGAVPFLVAVPTWWAKPDLRYSPLAVLDLFQAMIHLSKQLKEVKLMKTALGAQLLHTC